MNNTIKYEIYFLYKLLKYNRNSEILIYAVAENSKFLKMFLLKISE